MVFRAGRHRHQTGKEKYVKGLCIVIVIGFALTGLSVWPAYGQDEEWSVFFTNSSGDRFYYNPRNIVRGQDKSVKVFQRALPGNQNSDIRELRSEMEFDCSKLAYRQLKTQTLSRNGAVRETSGPAQWNSISPGSVTEALSRKACSGVKIRDRDR